MLGSLDGAQGRATRKQAETIAELSEAELLGLDKPTKAQELHSKNEATEVSRAVYLLDFGNREEKVMRILERFNLTEGAYNPETNPRGIFIEGETYKNTDFRRLPLTLALRLIGANALISKEFFGSINSVKGLSPVALATIEEADRRREYYPVDHLDEFPLAQKSLERIQAYGGPALENLFHPKATIPPVGTWVSRAGGRIALTFEMVLVAVAEALSGKSHEAEIARKLHTPVGNLNNLFHTGSRKQILSDETLALIAAKIRKDKA